MPHTFWTRLENFCHCARVAQDDLWVPRDQQPTKKYKWQQPHHQLHQHIVIKNILKEHSNYLFFHNIGQCTDLCTDMKKFSIKISVNNSSFCCYSRAFPNLVSKKTYFWTQKMNPSKNDGGTPSSFYCYCGPFCNLNP